MIWQGPEFNEDGTPITPEPQVSRLLLSLVIVTVGMFALSRGLLWIWRAL